jgi:hypothetical protein
VMGWILGPTDKDRPVEKPEIRIECPIQSKNKGGNVLERDFFYAAAFYLGPGRYEAGRGIDPEGRPAPAAWASIVLISSQSGGGESRRVSCILRDRSYDRLASQSTWASGQWALARKLL